MKATARRPQRATCGLRQWLRRGRHRRGAALLADPSGCNTRFPSARRIHVRRKPHGYSDRVQRYAAGRMRYTLVDLFAGCGGLTAETSGCGCWWQALAVYRGAHGATGANGREARRGGRGHAVRRRGDAGALRRSLAIASMRSGATGAPSSRTTRSPARGHRWTTRRSTRAASPASSARRSERRCTQIRGACAHRRRVFPQPRRIDPCEAQ